MKWFWVVQISSEMKTPKINQIINRLFNFSNISDIDITIICGQSSRRVRPRWTIGIGWNDGWLWVVLRKVTRIAISRELFGAIRLAELHHLSIFGDESWIWTLFYRTWSDSHWSFIRTAWRRWGIVRGFPGYTMGNTDIFKLIEDFIESVHNLLVTRISLWYNFVFVIRVPIRAHRAWTIANRSAVKFCTRYCSKTKTLCHCATSFYSPTCCRFGGQFGCFLSVGGGGLDRKVQTIAELGQAVSRLDYQTKTKERRKQLLFLKSKLKRWIWFLIGSKMSVSRSVIFGPTPGVAIVFDRNNPPKSSMTQWWSFVVNVGQFVVKMRLYSKKESS